MATTRVEIDALLAVVGAEALWKAVELRMNEEAGIRDLRRSLELEVPLPDYLADLIEKIQITAKSIGRPILDRELNNLAKWKRGLVDVEAMEKRIVRSVSSEMSEEIRLKRIAPILKKTLKALDSIHNKFNTKY